MFFPSFGMFPRRGTFEQNYLVYPVSFIGKSNLENGDKVILPPSALDRLASLNIDYPMLFEVQNQSVDKTSHCGVLEFTADEGMLYMPYWMMQNLLLQEGDMVKMKSATLPKGNFVKLQPHTSDFLDISNPKAVLETTLRNFSCLTKGDNIMVAYNNKNYYIDIVEARPADAISIIETDCEVDFAPPLDYVEPQRQPVVPAVKEAPGTVASNRSGETVAPEDSNEVPSFSAFTGSGRRLDGRPSKFTNVESSPGATVSGSRISSVKATAVKEEAANGKAANGSKPRAAGKLVFGSSPSKLPSAPKENNAAAAEKQVKAKEEEKEKKPTFEAFKGKGYSLK